MQDPEFVHQAFSAIAPRYVVANHVLSGGIDVLWRRLVARRVALHRPQRILDVASGSGDLAAAVLRTCPQAHVIASDFCAPMLEHARRRGLKDLVVADGMNLPFADHTFDALTVGFGLRNMADYGAALREFRRVLRPGGRLYVLDFSLPPAFLRPFYRAYLHHVLPTIAGWITGQAHAYRYLGGSIESFPSGQAMGTLIQDQGYTACEWQPLTGGIATLYEATRHE